MTALEILDKCKKQDILLSVEEGRLKVKSKKNKLTQEFKELIGNNKESLLDFLSGANPSLRTKIQKKPHSCQFAPLSFSQQRLWFIDKLSRGSVQYNSLKLFKVSGKFDVAIAEEAICRIISRHESLRTVIVETESGPVQKVNDTFKFKIDIYDLEHVSSEKIQGEAEKIFQEKSKAPYDLEKDLMVRCAYIRLCDGIREDGQPFSQGFLLFDVHHIATDGWSMGILVKEFVEHYRAIQQNRVTHLKPLELQYSDYAYWQRNDQQKEDLLQQENYWKKQLADVPETYGLPLDHPRPVTRKNSGYTIKSTLSPRLTAKLKKFSEACDLTLFMLLHAGLSIVLSRHSGSADVVIGTPVANRMASELDSLIGFFVNMLVLRTNTSHSDFNAYIEHVKKVNLEAQVNQDVPFERVVEICETTRSNQYSPLFQILFTLDTVEKTEVKLPEFCLKLVERESVSTKFDLDISAQLTDDAIKLSWHFDCALFDAASVEKLDQHFHQILQSIVNSESNNIHQLEMLSNSEIDSLLHENNYSLPYQKDKLLHQLFEDQVKSYPQNMAVYFEGKSFSYMELNNRANQLARFLRSKGIGSTNSDSNQFVGIYIERSIEMIVGILAVLKAGGAYVPLDPNYPLARISHMIKDSGLNLILTSPNCSKTLSAESALCVEISESNKCVNKLQKHNLSVNGQLSNSLAYVIYTSGSTGLPKGVLIEHRGLINLARYQKRDYGLSCDSRVLHFSSISFDASVFEWMMALTNGASLYICAEKDRYSPEKLTSFFVNHKITHSLLTPSVLRNIPEDKAFALQALIVGGESCDRKLVDRWADKYPLYNAYGPTESTVVASFTRLRVGEPIHIGKAVANTQLYVLGEARELLPAGTVGELYIGGDGLARGYLNRVQLTQDRFVPNPFSSNTGARLYRTGDYARYLPDGNMEFIGRVDEQIKIRGFRVELEEIEKAICNYSNVADSLVTAYQNDNENKFIVAYILCNKSDEKITDKLRAYLDTKLPEYMVPACIIVLDSFPLTPNGKIDKKALPSPDFSQYRALYREPVSENEIILSNIWRELLSVDKVGLDDNFFKLGGHSLLVMQMLSCLKQYDLQVAVREVFEEKTLASLAAKLEPVSEEAFKVPANLIPVNCTEITADMLPLISVSSNELKKIISLSPGGEESIQDIYPLSPLQEGLLFHHRLSDAKADPYVLASLFKCDSEAQFKNFVSSLQKVVDRHDILRSSFLWEGLEKPVQLVNKNASIPVELIEFDKFDAGLEYLQDLAKQGEHYIDLSGDTAMAITAVKSQKEPGVAFILRIHHIVNDHVSGDILIKEVKEIMSGREDMLPAPFPYRNFIAYLNQHNNHSQFKEYFKDKLFDVEDATIPFAVVDMHTDRNQIVEWVSDFSCELSEEISATARSLGVNSASLFHLAWALVVSACSGKQDIVFGSVFSGRLQHVSNSDSAVGLFMNTLPVRLQVEQGIMALLNTIHCNLKELLEFEQTPLSEIRQCCSIPNETPLFTAVINYRHIQQTVNEGADNAFAGIRALGGQEKTNYPLILSVNDYGDRFSTKLQSSNAIDPQRVSHYIETALKNILLSLRQQDACLASKISILPADEKKQLMQGWNPDNFDSMNNGRFIVDREKSPLIHDWFAQQALATPNAIAVVYQDEQISYAELNLKANLLAIELVKKGVQHEDLVGICMDRSVAMIISMFAILKAGAAYVPLDPNYPQSRINFMVEDSGIAILITQEHLVGRFPDLASGLLVFDDNPKWENEELQKDELDKYERSINAGNLSHNSLAYIIYTSGSTGLPKGVMIEHGALSVFLKGMKENLGSVLSSGTKLLALTTISFDISVFEIFATLLHGGCIVVAGSEQIADPLSIMQIVERHNINVLQGTPSTWKMLRDAGWQGKNDLVAITGGEILPNDLADYLLDHCKTLFNGYGPTETTIYSALKKVRVDPNDENRGYLGASLSNYQHYILDKNKEFVPFGAVGECYVAGDCLARGYLNREDLTREKFTEMQFSNSQKSRIYQTGDLVRYLPSGEMEFIGRIDDQVKIRGFRIELGEIEKCILASNKFSSCVVVVKDASEQRKQIVAYLVLKEETIENDIVASTRKYLHEKLPDYMVPAAFVILEKLPLTPNSKLNKKALPPVESTDLHDIYVPPQNKTEKLLAKIWGNLLGLSENVVSRSANFYELGGDSLLATKLYSQLQKEFGLSTKQFSLRDMFNYRVLADLAEIISSMRLRVEQENVKASIELNDLIEDGEI